MVGKGFLRIGRRGIAWASAWLALTVPYAAEAGCTFTGHSYFCVGEDGSASVTTWSGNTVFTTNSNGDYTVTTRAPGLSVSHGVQDGTSWSETRTTIGGRTSWTTTIDPKPQTAFGGSAPAAATPTHLEGLPVTTYVCFVC